MPAATLIVASLAALEPPRPGVERPIAFLQTTWSLSASPRALAAAPQRPIVGPGQARPSIGPPPPATEDKGGEVTVAPATDDDELKDFDALADPAAATDPAAVDPAAADSAGGESTAAATDPFEDELAQSIKPDSDPLEGFNRISFSVSQVIDKALLRPLSLGYVKVMPKPARDGLRNVMAHWGAPLILANDLLQLKPKRAIKTLGRFIINTLLGLGGVFDVAKEKKFNLPHHGNRFSNTLAMYGIKFGPYVYLPVLGPTTLLDQIDRVQGYVPGFDNPIFRDGRGTAGGYMLGLEDRANSDVELKALLDDAVDPYATFRTTWLQDRQGEVNRLKAPDGVDPNTYTGAPEPSPLDDPLDDPLENPAAPAEAESPAPEVATPAP